MKDPNSHAAAWLALLDTQEAATLGPERRAGTLSLAELDAQIPPPSSALGGQKHELARGVAYLWHDHLDAAHEIAQAIENSDGSLLHAIMHRREPDYWNSKYWFRRAGSHPCFAALGEEAAERLASAQAHTASFLRNRRWDACAFVDACEKAASSRSREGVLVLQEAQRLEFRAFLSFLLP